MSLSPNCHLMTFLNLTLILKRVSYMTQFVSLSKINCWRGTLELIVLKLLSQSMMITILIENLIE